jgi:hypothetical protein
MSDNDPRTHSVQGHYITQIPTFEVFIIFNSWLRRFSNKGLSVSSALNDDFLSFPSSF